MYYIKLCTSKRGWQGGRVAKAKVMKEWLGNLPSFFQLLITPLNICHIPDNFKSDHADARGWQI